MVNTVDYIIGGISTVIMNYYEKLDREKYQMDFVITQNIVPKYQKIMENGGAITYNLQRNRNPLLYFVQLMRIIRQNHYDVVHVHGNSCTMAVDMAAAKLAGCRRIIAHSHNSTCSHLKMHKLLRPLFEWSCHERLACSEVAGEWLFHKKKFTILENALDLTKYHYNERIRYFLRSQMGVAETDLVIGHVGIFNTQKNHRFLIEIMRYFVENVNKQVHLFLVGEGGLRSEIEQLVNMYGLSKYVTFFGNTDDIPGVMSAMDVFLFPSLHEGLGIVMIEAQLMGLPCVASSVVPKDVEISDNCVFLPLDAPYSEWANQLVQIGKCNRMQKSQIKRIDRFDLQIQVKKLEEIYNG